MGRPKSDSPMSIIFTIRFTKLEYTALRGMSDRANMLMPQMMRKIIFDAWEMNEGRSEPIDLMTNWPPMGRWKNHSSRDIQWRFRIDQTLNCALKSLGEMYGYSKAEPLVRKLIENAERLEGISTWSP